MTDPDNLPPLRVVYRRNPCGAVASLEIWRGAPDDDASTLMLDTAACEIPDVALQDILWTARGYYKADPADDTLPPDYAVIAMYEDHIA